MKKFYLLLGIVSLILAVSVCQVQAVTWPSEGAWTPLLRGGGLYTDTLNDENPNWVDIVGDSTTHAAGFWHIDDMGSAGTSDDILMFRMRLHQNGLGRNSVWQFVLDTDLDGGADWSLQLDNKTDNRVEFVIATSPGPPFAIPPGTNPTEFDGTNAFWSSTDLDAYRRWSTAGDGSNFGGDDDIFLDAAMPWDEFSTITGLKTPLFGVILTTSSDHNNINKDHPDDNETFSNPIPEPATALGVVSAMVGLAGYIKRRLVS